MKAVLVALGHYVPTLRLKRIYSRLITWVWPGFPHA